MTEHKALPPCSHDSIFECEHCGAHFCNWCQERVPLSETTTTAVRFCKACREKGKNRL